MALIFRYAHKVYSGNNYAGGYVDEVGFALNLLEIPEDAHEVMAFKATIAEEYNFDVIMALRKVEVDKAEKAAILESLRDELREANYTRDKVLEKIKELENE